MSSPWTISSTSLLVEGCRGCRCARCRLTEPLQGLLRCAPAFAFHTTGVLAIEVEPCEGQVLDETEACRAGRVDQMGEHVVHGPPVAERRFQPLIVLQVREVVDERRTLGVHDGPDIVRHSFSFIGPASAY